MYTMPLFPSNHIIPFSSQYKEIEKEMGRDPIQESKKLQATTKAWEPNPWKRALQVLLLSILLLSCSPSCLHSINLSTTTTLLSNLNHFINRKAVFLFLNAIILFLVKNSGLLSPCSAPVDEPCDEFLVMKDHQQPKAEAVETEADVSRATVESHYSSDLVMIEGRGDEDGKAAMEIKPPAVIGGGRGGDEEGNELAVVDEMKDIGIDELNRKIEEFIERVKRERRLEALQLVIHCVT